MHGWHNALFQGGCWEVCKIKIVSVQPQRLQIHYKAVPAERIKYEMTNFLNFINKSYDNPYIKSAIAQLWLAIIHLYGDGNSRLARALAHFWLSDSGNRLYSISSVIFANKNGYYENLEQTTKLN